MSRHEGDVGLRHMLDHAKEAASRRWPSSISFRAYSICCRDEDRPNARRQARTQPSRAAHMGRGEGMG